MANAFKFKNPKQQFRTPIKPVVPQGAPRVVFASHGEVVIPFVDSKDWESAWRMGNPQLARVLIDKLRDAVYAVAAEIEAREAQHNAAAIATFEATREAIQATQASLDLPTQ